MVSSGFDRVDEARLFELYEDEERKVEKEAYRSYHDVLTKTTLRVAKKVGWSLPIEEAGFLAKSLSSWEPFEDTNPTLVRLSQRCKLGILSNVDENLLRGTLRHLSVPFDLIVTAEQVHAYKPDRAHFDRAREVIGWEKEWVHIAGSLYHDIGPAQRLGIKAIWMNRKHLTLPSGLAKGLVREVHSLRGLMRLLFGEPAGVGEYSEHRHLKRKQLNRE